MFWIHSAIILFAAYALYKQGNRLYWNQRYFNDKTNLHDCFQELIRQQNIDPSHLKRYIDISWEFRDVECRKDFNRYLKDKEDALSFLPSEIKKKRNKKIDELLSD